MSNDDPMPFGLNRKDIAGVEIVYSAFSVKSGAGRSEIRISGSGNVRLLEEANAEDPEPRIREGALSQTVIIRLLDVMEDEGFVAMDDLFPHDGVPTGVQVIEVSLPETNKKVMVDQPAFCAPCERIAGAIKLAAAIGLPETLQQRFFRRL